MRALRPTPERQALHDRVLAEWEATFPDARRGRRAIGAAGPPRPMKASLRFEMRADRPKLWRIALAEEFVDRLLYLALVDGWYAELVPPEIAEFEAQGERFFPRMLSNLLIDEAEYLTSVAVERSVREGYDVIVYLDDPDAGVAFMDQFTATGYTPQVAIGEDALESLLA